MGLFDSFEVPPDTLCPTCKHQVEELQTKAFPNPYLRTVSLGGRLLDEDVFRVVDGRLEAHEICMGCDSWLEYWAIIKDGLYVGVELAKAKPQSTERQSGGDSSRTQDLV